MKKKKTAARKGTCNPVWNEALSFNVASSNLSNIVVEVSVESVFKQNRVDHLSFHLICLLTLCIIFTYTKYQAHMSLYSP